MQPEIIQGIHAAREAAGHLPAILLDGSIANKLTDALHGSNDPNAIAARAAIGQAGEHAQKAAQLLSVGIGELATYTADMYLADFETPEQAALKAHQKWVAGVREQADTHERKLATPAHPDLSVSISYETLQRIIATIPKLRTISNVTTAVYELPKLPGLPDMVLRVGLMYLYTRKQACNAEQSQRHMDEYQAALIRLHASGIPITGYAYNIADSPHRHDIKLYVVAKRHPNPGRLDLPHDTIPDTERYETALFTIEKLLNHYADFSHAPIYDLRARQFAADGTLLDIDPHLCTEPRDRHRALQELTMWLFTLPLPAGVQHQEKRQQLMDRITQIMRAESTQKNKS
jgi:hypothetical protein